MNTIQSTIDQVLSGKKELIINITDDKNYHVGTLQPITVKHLQCADIIEKLTDWRNLNMQNFLTQFFATSKRTRNWIKKMLSENKGQMLFLIYESEKIIGHYGFKNLTANDVLLDNAMRGERDGDPKLLVYAGIALVKWLFTQAKVNQIRAEVMTDNIPAIMMNKRIGFGDGSCHPLLRQTEDSNTHWEIGQEGKESPEDKYCFKLILKKNQFFS